MLSTYTVQAILGQTWHDFGDLEAFLVALGSLFGGLVVALGGSRGLLGLLGPILATQGSGVKAILAILGVLRVVLGRLLGGLGAQLGRSWGVLGDLEVDLRHT